MSQGYLRRYSIGMTLNSIKFVNFNAKISLMYREVIFENSFENYLADKYISIYKLIHLLCIGDVAKHLERTCYTNKSWHFNYSIFCRIKFFVLKCFRKL